MFIRFSERLRNEDKGFTLIELMVVVLIIAILIAIAIPTFLGARKRAQDRQAQSNLRNGLTAEKTYYTEPQVYTNSETALGEIESNLNWTTDEAAARGVRFVSFGAAGSTQVVVLESLSKSGTRFCIADVAQNLGSGTVTTNPLDANAKAGTYFAKVASASACSGTAAWGPTTTAWS